MPIIKIVYGIHKPRYESDSAVLKYSRGIGLQGEIYRLKDYSEENRKKYRYLGNTMPDVVIFNTKGQLTKFEINCSGSLDSIVELSPHDIDSMRTEIKTLQDFIEDSYKIINPASRDLISNKKPVYALKFAEFAGRINKENVPKLVELLKHRTDVEYVLLNMDYTQ